MENSRFVTVNLRNGDYFCEMTKRDANYLLSENILKVEMVDEKGNNIYVVKSNDDIPYIKKFYSIDIDEEIF